MSNPMNKKVLAFAISAAFCAAATSAYAEGWYVGAGVGNSHSHLGGSDVAADAMSVLGSAGYTFNNMGSGMTGGMTDRNATGLKFFGGRQINSHFAIEGQFQGLDKVKGQFTGTVDGPEGASGTSSYESTGLGIAAVGILPITKDFSAFGKLGLMHWSSSMTTSAVVGTFSPVMVSRTVKDNGNDAYYGLGLKYDLTPGAGLRLEWERSRIHSGNNDLLSANIVFGF
jgi:hypothetical protein